MCRNDSSLRSAYKQRPVKLTTNVTTYVIDVDKAGDVPQPTTQIQRMLTDDLQLLADIQIDQPSDTHTKYMAPVAQTYANSSVLLAVKTTAEKDYRPLVRQT